MGLEHLGVVVGETVDDFVAAHRSAFDGQQFQSEVCKPYLVSFEDFTNVKFYRYSLADVLRREGHAFDGFVHADDWQPAAEQG